MKKNSIKVYDLAVILMSMKVMLDRVVYLNSIKFLDTILMIISLFLFIVVILMEQKYSGKQWVVIVGTGILCLYSSIQMKEYFLIISYFLIIASVNKNINYTVRIMRRVKIIFIVVSIIWYVFSYFVVKDTLFTVIKNGRIAHHFGFTHPNGFALVICWIMLETLYLNINNFKMIYMYVYVILGIALYKITSCDTAMYILILASVLKFSSYYTILNKLQVIVAKYIFPVCGILNFLCVYIYTKQRGILYKFILLLDEFLTARIRQVALIASRYDFTLLGHNVPIGQTVPYDSYYKINLLVCDGLFSYFLVCMGIIYTIIISLLIWKYIKYNPEHSIIVILFSCYSILELHGLNVYIAYPLLLFASDFLKRIRHKGVKVYYD